MSPDQFNMACASDDNCAATALQKTPPEASSSTTTSCPTSFTIGSRGYIATVNCQGLDIRMYYRAYDGSGKLIDSGKYVVVRQGDWADLLRHIPAVDQAIKVYQLKERNPQCLLPLGTNGLHVSVSPFNGCLYVHIRYYSRAFFDPDQLRATKRGIALKVDEWQDLMKNMQTVTDILLV
jgi:hypothetical protein